MNLDSIHRAKHRQLWFDKVRSDLDRLTAPADMERTLKMGALNGLKGGDVSSFQRIMNLSQNALGLEFVKYDLTDPLPVIALRALKAQGYPQRELSAADVPRVDAKVSAALNWCSYDILHNPATRIMLLDDRTAKSVADSKNNPITATELQHLPHNPCVIEFYRPIEIGEEIHRGLRVRAVGFEALGNADVPAAVVSFFMDYWVPAAIPDGARSPATIAVWFGGFTSVTIDNVIRSQFAMEPLSDREKAVTELCQKVSRNLWDFITMRTIRYDSIHRKSAKHPLEENRPRHVQGLRSQLDREVFHLYLIRETKVSKDPDGRPHEPLWGYRIEVPGVFHEWIYCARCRHVHKHELVGQPCRTCGEVVGPRANIWVQKYWHRAHLRGPEGAPIKEVVRDVHRKKRRR